MRIGTKQYIIFALSVLVMVSDFFIRVSIDHTSDIAKQYEFPLLSSQKMKVEPQSKVSTLYEAFDKVIEAPVKIITEVKPDLPPPPPQLGIGQENEDKQSGLIPVLFFGNNEVTLTGIFTNQSKFAIIAIKDLATKRTSIKKVLLGETFFEYKVDGINSKSINLSRKSQKIELRLFTK